jgi:hypothetical protein
MGNSNKWLHDYRILGKLYHGEKSTSYYYCGDNPLGHKEYFQEIWIKRNYLEEENPWKVILSATTFAIRSTYHTALYQLPGQLVFGGDMIVNILETTNWEHVKQRKQGSTYQNNLKKLSAPSLFTKLESKVVLR